MSDVARILTDCCALGLCYLCLTRATDPRQRPVYYGSSANATVRDIEVMGTNGASLGPDEADRPLLACATMARDDASCEVVRV